MESPDSPSSEKMQLAKSKVMCMLIIFFDVKGIVHKEFVLADQTVNSAYNFYGDCVKTCEDSAPNFGDKTTGCCITTTHRLTLSFFTREFLTKGLSSPPTQLFYPLPY
jgi:hypothetical protein